MILSWFRGVLELPASCVLLSVWMSAAASHLGLLDRVVSKSVKLSDGLVVCDLENRRSVSALCMFYKIYCNSDHALEAAVP